MLHAALASLLGVLPLDPHAFNEYARRRDLHVPQAAARRCGPGTPFVLAAVGDVLLHANIQKEAEKSSYDKLFDAVRPWLGAADAAYANFEGSVNPAKPLSSFPEFNYNPVLAPALAGAGFDFVSTANNHALDTGPEGVDGALEALDAAGLLHHGTTHTGASKAPFQLVEVANRAGERLKLGFISFTFSTNLHPDPNAQVNMLWAGERPNRTLAPELLEAVKAARAASEVVVVALHWGVEYQFLPEKEQEDAAAALAAAGVDLILGDHPHTVQPPAWLDGPDGRETLVIYSLGNFIAAQGMFQERKFTQTTMVFYVGLVRPPGGPARVAGYRYLPLYIAGNLAPEPLTARQRDRRKAWGHLLEQLRDPHGEALVPAEVGVLAGGVAVCPGPAQ